MQDFTLLVTTFFIACIGIAISRAIWKSYVTSVVVPMHHRSIHSRNGKLIDLLESGSYRFFGTGQQFQYFDNRLQQLTLQTQELTTLEGITVKTTAVALFRIADPLVATAGAADFNATLYTIIQLALRDAVSGMAVDALLSKGRSLGPTMMETIQDKVASIGLEVTELVVRDVILPADIKAVLSEYWRSQKSSLAEIETARGKAAVARTLANAAKLYETNPSLLKIRYIEALEQATKGMGNTFVIGLSEDKTLKHI